MNKSDSANKSNSDKPDTTSDVLPAADSAEKAGDDANANKEFGGPKGLEPTRYGDWEKAGRCIDF